MRAAPARQHCRAAARNCSAARVHCPGRWREARGKDERREKKDNRTKRSEETEQKGAGKCDDKQQQEQEEENQAHKGARGKLTHTATHRRAGSERDGHHVEHKERERLRPPLSTAASLRQPPPFACFALLCPSFVHARYPPPSFPSLDFPPFPQCPELRPRVGALGPPASLPHHVARVLQVEGGPATRARACVRTLTPPSLLPPCRPHTHIHTHPHYPYMVYPHTHTHTHTHTHNSRTHTLTHSHTHTQHASTGPAGRRRPGRAWC